MSKTKRTAIVTGGAGGIGGGICRRLAITGQHIRADGGMSNQKAFQKT